MELKITIIQPDIFWENPKKNINHIDSLITSVSEKTDLIILPEMFTTGFTMNAAPLAETQNGPTITKMEGWAKETGAAIIGSIIIEEGSRYYNRLICMNPDGSTDFYDKRHLFRFAGENQAYTPGKEKIIIKLKGWRILPLICYDLRFPVWSRNRFIDNQLEYDSLVYIASWPEARIDAMDILLKARAVENLSYVIGVNRIGTDGNDLVYPGHSTAVDPKGKTVYQAGSSEEIFTITLKKKELNEFRGKFAAYLDADEFYIQ